MKTENYDNMIELYEETIKNLYRLTEMAREAMRGATMLDEKLLIEKLRIQCEQNGQNMRLNIFAAQDANKYRGMYLKKIKEDI